MCFQCIPSLMFSVEAFVRFRPIVSLFSGITDHHDEQVLLASFCQISSNSVSLFSGITDHHDEQVLLASFLAFVKQNISKALKHEHICGPTYRRPYRMLLISSCKKKN